MDCQNCGIKKEGNFKFCYNCFRSKDLHRCEKCDKPCSNSFDRCYECNMKKKAKSNKSKKPQYNDDLFID